MLIYSYEVCSCFFNSKLKLLLLCPFSRFFISFEVKVSACIITYFYSSFCHFYDVHLYFFTVCFYLSNLIWDQKTKSSNNHKFCQDRSSHRRCSVRKGVIRNFTKFTGKHLWQSLFLNKVANTASSKIHQSSLNAINWTLKFKILVALIFSNRTF